MNTRKLVAMTSTCIVLAVPLALSTATAASAAPMHAHARIGAAADRTTDSDVKIIARDARGQATQVTVNGHAYDVCIDGKQDNCINPRQAGLHFGNWPLKDWPGQPASQSSSG